MIILREDVDQKVDDVTFEQGEVYSVDVAFSSGEGMYVCTCVCIYVCLWLALLLFISSSILFRSVLLFLWFCLGRIVVVFIV